MNVAIPSPLKHVSKSGTLANIWDGLFFQPKSAHALAVYTGNARA